MLIYKSDSASVDSLNRMEYRSETVGEPDIDQVNEPFNVANVVCLQCRKTRRKLSKVFSYVRSHLKFRRSRTGSNTAPSTASSVSAAVAPKKFVLFDLGGVIVTPPQKALLKYCEEIGLPRNFIFKVMSQPSAKHVFGSLEMGEITVAQFAAEFENECRRVAVEQGVVFPERFSATDMIKFKDPDLIPEMLNAVAVLKENGIKTCALTNNYIDNTHSRAYAAGGLTAFTLYFDEFVESCRFGIRKPDPRIFQEALTRLGAEIKDTVFLDDTEVNTKAAEALGMSTILVQDTQEALHQLKLLTGSDVFKDAGPLVADSERVTHCYVTTRSKVRFHFAELGNGPPIVLCHDFDQDWEAWKEQMPVLALSGFRAIALDLKGFGESSQPADMDQYQLKTLCRDMMEFLDAMAIPQVTLIGKGIGAALVWTFANHNTDRVRAVAGIKTMPSVMLPETLSCDGLNMIKGVGALGDYIRFRQSIKKRSSTDTDAEHFYKIAVHQSSDTNPMREGYCFHTSNGFGTGMARSSSRASLSCLCGELADNKKRRGGSQNSSSKTKSKGSNWFRNNQANWEWNRRLHGRKLLIPALAVTSGQGSPKDAPDVADLNNWIPELEHKHISACENKTDKERSSELNEILQSWLFNVYKGEHTPLLPMW